MLLSFTRSQDHPGKENLQLRMRSRIKARLAVLQPHFFVTKPLVREKGLKIFLPLLLLYCFITFALSTDDLFGDEARYLKFATNLSKGYYSPEEAVDLTNGPGYPLLLLPFVAFKAPLLSAKLLNPIFLFCAILYFYQTLLLYMDKKAASRSTYLLGLYPPILRWLPFLYTEILTFFLICAFMFHFCKLHQDSQHKRRDMLIVSLCLAYLALTKIIFGYVIVSGLLFFTISYLIKRTGPALKSSLPFLAALVFCSPYLIYTYSLTGKFFYWGSSGGNSLYWMSTPYKNEFGDWFSINDVYAMPQLSKNHMEFFKELAPISKFEQDQKLKKKALENIRSYPTKYLRNWAANVGRLLFNYPYSYTPQKLTTYVYILPNIFLIVLFVFSIYPGYLRRKSVPFEIKAIMLFGLIAFGGSSMVSALTRQFTILVPILLLWISFTLMRLIRIELRN